MRLLAPALALVLPVVLLAPWARRRPAPGADAPAAASADATSAAAGSARARDHADETRPRARALRCLGQGAVGPIAPAAVVAVALVAVVVVVVVAGIPVPMVVAVGVIVVLGRARLVSARRRRRGREVERAGPDLVDLLTVAAAAGHPPHRCLHVVADRAPPAVQPSVRASCRRLERGVPLAVAVDELRRGMGALGDPVADALLDAFRTGAPLQPALARVGEVARDRRRRAAEAEARRLPVLLLFPLVCCVLPAFGLLAVVPLIAASVRSLG